MSISSEITALQTNLANAKDAVTAKGGTVGNTGLAGLASEIAGIPSGDAEIDYGKDINFYDYDGTLVEAWTLGELQTKTALPTQPTHEGLTADGWNWSLAGLKSLNLPMNVGALYHPTDNKNHFIIELKEDTLKPAFVGKMNLDNAAVLTVEWGDGTTTTYDGPTGSNNFVLRHQYSAPGTYDVKISSKTSGGEWTTNFGLFMQGVGIDNGDTYPEGITRSSQNTHVGFWDYQYAVKEIWCSGDNPMGSPSSLSVATPWTNYRGIRAVVLGNGAKFPSGSVGGIGTAAYVPVYCARAKEGTAKNIYCYPETATGFYDKFVGYACTDAILTLPQTATEIGYLKAIRISSAGACRRLTFPAKLTTISTSIGIVARVYDFSRCEQIPTLSVSYAGLGFTGAQILVPAALEADWKAASRWSDYADNIIGV